MLHFALIIFALLFLPEQAFAWGPGVHMVTGNWVLQNLSVLPLPVAAVLMQYPGQFLHGTLSADIFIGKGSKAQKGHSHNWESGFSLLDKADTSQKLSYAYGYLAHLASDTVAHNVFVPGLFHTAPGAGRLAHVYLEAQADRLFAWDSADAVGVFREAGSLRTTAMLRATLRQKSLPFWIKKQLFQRSIAVGGSRLWRHSMRLVDHFIPEHERGPLVERMLTLSTRAIVNLLQHDKRSLILKLDPVGARALAEAALDTGNRQGMLKGMATRLFCATADSRPAQPQLRITVPPLLEAFPPICVPDGKEL